MPLTALIFMGVSGCGKSTIAAAVAKDIGWPMIEGDDLHPPANIEKMSHGIPLDDDDRRPWLQAIAARIAEWRDEGTSGIVTCSSLKHTYRDVLRSGHDDVHFIYLKGSYELLLSRMRHRERHFMPPSLLQSQFATLEAPGPEEAITVEIGRPVEEIVAEVLTKLAILRAESA